MCVFVHMYVLHVNKGRHTPGCTYRRQRTALLLAFCFEAKPIVSVSVFPIQSRWSELERPVTSSQFSCLLCLPSHCRRITKCAITSGFYKDSGDYVSRLG